jgi:hypothetical protein
MAGIQPYLVCERLEKKKKIKNYNDENTATKWRE